MISANLHLLQGVWTQRGRLAADMKQGTTKIEAAAAAISNGVEVLLRSQEHQKQSFPDTHQLLSQPMIWIRDMATTMDMTPHDLGMVGIKKPDEMVHIVMGNKQVEKSIAIGDIPGIVCDNQGNQKLAVKMKNVYHLYQTVLSTCLASPND